MRIVFAGTPEAAVPTLRALVEAGHEVVLVVTREDAPRGRKRALTPSEVAVAAGSLNLPVLKTNRLDDEATKTITAAAADLGVVVAFGALLREPLLSAPTHGWLNLHFSALPRWRGAAPVQHALIAGDSEIGVSVFQLDTGLDTGLIVAQVEHAVPAGITAGELLEHLSQEGAEVVLDAVAQLEKGTAVLMPQQGKSSLAPKLTRETGRITFSQPAAVILHRWAGVTPEPGAYAEIGNESVKLLALQPTPQHIELAPGEAKLVDNQVLIGTATQPVQLTRVQPAGKQGMSASDWLRGRGGSVLFDAN